MEEILYTLIMYGNCVFEIFLFHVFLEAMSPVFEERKSAQYGAAVGCATVLYAVNSLGNPYLNLAGSLSVFVLYAWLIFRTDLKHSLLYAVFCIVLLAILEFVFQYVYRTFGIDSRSTDIRRSCVLIMEDLFGFIVIQAVKKIHRNAWKDADYSNARSLFIQPMAVLLLLNGIVIRGQFPYDYLCIFIGGILNIVSNIVNFSMVERLLEAENAVQENELLKLKTSLERSHYRRMEQVNREYAGYLHEMRHIVQTIRQLSDTENAGVLKQLSEEASKLLEKRSLLDEGIYTDDPVMNAVLTERAQTAREKDIEYEVNIQPGVRLDFVSETDKIRIFGNLIDNALEAAGECKNGYVSVNLRTANESMSILQVRNSFRHQNRKKGMLYETTKADKRQHGFGLKNVYELADKYCGLLNITEEQNEFSVLLALSNIQKTEKK